MRAKTARAQPALAMDPIVVPRSNAMIVRTSLIALALAAVAGTAFAAPADPATPAKAPAKTHAKCEKRSAAGHCEKWATSTKTSAKPAAKADTAAKPAK
jgi:hypothetical protein